MLKVFCGSHTLELYFFTFFVNLNGRANRSLRKNCSRVVNKEVVILYLATKETNLEV